MKIDDSPRRVWLGVTIPGKKMVRVLGATGLDAGRELNYLYEEPVSTVLLAVAHALHRLPSEGAMGPALRDLPPTGSAGPQRELFGAVLTDIRDFLKLRFRALGIGKPLSADALTSGAWPSASDPTSAVNFMISALDGLAKTELTGSFREVIWRLRDLSKETARQSDPRLQTTDLVGQMAAKLYEEPWS